MNDEELAKAVIAYGIGWQTPRSLCYSIAPSPTPTLDASRFVRSRRVAGACLQMWPTTISVPSEGPLSKLTLDEMLRDPHATIEAYVLAKRGITI